MMTDTNPRSSNQKAPKSKSRSTLNGKSDELVQRTTQVYESQWEALAVMSALRGDSIATLVREALDGYITEKGLRPKLMTQLKSMFQAEVSQLIGEHLKLSEERSRAEIAATQKSLEQLVAGLKVVLGEGRAQRRELDQVLAFLEGRNVPIKRG